MGCLESRGGQGAVVAFVHLDPVLKKKVKIPIHRESGGFEAVMRFWSKIKKRVEYFPILSVNKELQTDFSTKLCAEKG